MVQLCFPFEQCQQHRHETKKGHEKYYRVKRKEGKKWMKGGGAEGREEKESITGELFSPSFKRAAGHGCLL